MSKSKSETPGPLTGVRRLDANVRNVGGIEAGEPVDGQPSVGRWTRFSVRLTAFAVYALLAAASNMLATAGSTLEPARVISYHPGSGVAPSYTHPEAALGAPSQVNPFGEPTDPFNPPYGTNQIVSIGAGGHLAIAFHRPILNHPNNLFGLDFTVFGNTGFIITNEYDLVNFDWIGTPATDGSLFGAGAGLVVVSVSRDGREFFVLNPAQSPRVDGFPPTDGAGDPGVPVPPGLTAAACAGATLDDLRALYQGSAGGASFALETALSADGRPVLLPEIRYLRIDVLEGRAEIDAIVPVNRVPPRGHP